MNSRTVLDARIAEREEVVEAVARVIQRGGLVVYPTDTVYRIGCDPYDAAAVDRIDRAKNRSEAHPLTLQLATVTEFLEYARDNPHAVAAAKRLLPGPVTLIVRKPAFIPLDVTAGLLTIGMRVPDDDLARAILERCGPIATSGAHRSDENASAGDGSFQDVCDADLVVENGPTRYRGESTVVDISGPQAYLLREGVLSLETIRNAIGPVERRTIRFRNTP